MAAGAASLIGWIDLSSDQLVKARTFIQDLREEGVLDELGFGILQTSISDVLYPATNTIMTRARYLYFIPAIYDQMERDRIRSAQARRESERRQTNLCIVLCKTEPSPGSGVIGRDKKEHLQRFPSNIYWNPLRMLGFMRRVTSEARYHQGLDEYYDALRPVRDDDRTAHAAAEAEPSWDPHRPVANYVEPGGTIKETTDFRLTREEAKDLRDRFSRLSAPEAPSLLSSLISEEETLDLSWPWDAPTSHPFLRKVLTHARALSALAWGMTIQYYSLLSARREEANLEPCQADLPTAFKNWFAQARPLLQDWDIDDFFRQPYVATALRRLDAEQIRGWHSLVLRSKSASSLLKDVEAQEIISKRERTKKPSKARLHVARQLELWKPPSAISGTYGLTYRHAVGSRIVRDIRAGLRRA
jgi:hypothetical protein